MPLPSEPCVSRRRLRLSGHVQGVGFRPFVYRLAHTLELSGSVRNLQGEVEIVVQGAPASLERFAHEVIEQAPALARPRLLSCEALAVYALDAQEVASEGATPDIPSCAAERFRILESVASEDAHVFVPPDLFLCDACLAELNDPLDRRSHYPFINCTACGPRYTLIESLPYDRARTTMASFALCEECAREYADPLDRRFHAEPVACAACGPQLWLEEDAAQAGTSALRGAGALARAVELLRLGRTLAVKGIGGYHLLCDATCTAAIERLRTRKRRPDKPLAVMFPQSGADGLARVHQEVHLTRLEAALLRSAARPIVLAARRRGGQLSEAIAPGLDEVGVLLPYSPLHHLLLADVDRPVVATSANLSGEPVLTAEAAVRTRLRGVADAALHHDRPIARPADDTVMRVVRGRARLLRAGRGRAPLERELPWRLASPVLAVGAHLKATVALAWENRAVVSPHIADLSSVQSEAVFAQIIEDLQRLYGVRAARVLCDAHPGYASSRWAVRSGLPLTRVLHHHAHASALAGEHHAEERLLVFAWDGVGYGDDGTLWGGETLLGGAGHWVRIGSVRPFRPPGGELAARAPWRSAAALCWELGTQLGSAFGPELDARAAPLARHAWEQRVNSPATSSIGRLFDAAAALVLGIRETSYEGQAPMQLESAARRALAGERHLQPRLAGALGLPRSADAQGLERLDWAPLVGDLMTSEDSPGARAALFHARLAASIVAIASEQQRRCGIECVGLTGGVFQNRLLTELAQQALEEQGFRVLTHECVPCNDGGLSYGQILEHAARARPSTASA
ncbi:MAG TPA: carbamoyltransferase HypF [Steroidobacteraceae bacterium]|nr:carbamoyltransferase HypF [Steroidobacteraceae bacterium]